MIQVENLCYHYHGCPPLLQQVGFRLEAGRFLAILGNNGAGKSTLLKCLNRILPADSGRVMMGETDLLSLPHREIAKRVAFVSQSIPDTQMTVRDMVMLGRRPYMRWGFSERDREMVRQVMERLHIGEELQGRFLSQLSGGERQKAVLARALAQEPRVLLLDEPTSSLDISNQYQVLRLVQDVCRRDGISAIMVIHDLNLALRFCDRFLLMRRGKIYRYGDRSVLDSASLEEVYGVQARVVEFEGQYSVLVHSERRMET